MIVTLAGIALAPLLPGTIQMLKARAQGRRGTTPLQPYRVLKRLWGKSAVDPEGTGVAYRLAPPGSATTRSCSSACSRSRDSRSRRRPGTPGTASR
jgi:formate hydrogenlyase subunit 4